MTGWAAEVSRASNARLKGWSLVSGAPGSPSGHRKACRRFQRGQRKDEADQCPLASEQSGKLSRELDFVSHHVRTKLDELKRQEVSRLRMLLKAKMDAEQEPSKRGRGRQGRWAWPPSRAARWIYSRLEGPPGGSLQIMHGQLFEFSF